MVVSPLVWILVGVVLGAIELFSATFVLMWLGIAAVVTGLLGFAVPAFGSQVVAFAVLSVVLLAVTRPLARRWRKGKNEYVSSIGHLVGEKGLVISKMVQGGTGMVRVGGDVWSARAHDAGERIDVGEWVEVRAVNSSTLIVSRIERP